jgi:hypothetical protein
MVVRRSSKSARAPPSASRRARHSTSASSSFGGSSLTITGTRAYDDFLSPVPLQRRRVLLLPHPFPSWLDDEVSSIAWT